MKARGLYDALFATFTRFQETQGFVSQRGTVIDARNVEVPKQRNTRCENATIKDGLLHADWGGNQPREPRRISRRTGLK